MTYVLGIDLGTSALKGVLMTEVGEVVATTSEEYPLSHIRPGYSEQNPEHWIEACQSVFNQLSQQITDFSDELLGMAVSGQMHGLVTLNSLGEVVRPAILWNDTRTTEQCECIMREFGADLLRITKNKALEGFTLSKILWMQEHEVELWEQVAHIMLPKDYLVWWLTGRFATDYSDAAGTLLLDLETNQWSKEILDHYNIHESLLPKLYVSTDVVGEVTTELKEEYRFLHDVKVIAGGADNPCAAVGAGIMTANIGMVSIGTSGVFLANEEGIHDQYNRALHLFNHAMDNTYYSMGVTLAAGHSLSWFRNTFAKELSYDDLLVPIDKIAIGADGLLFTPYIVGERTPYADSHIRGSFIGIDTHHRLEHFTRSVIEGITFSLRDVQEEMVKVSGKTFDKIISVGGGAKNTHWLQIQANVFNTPIATLATEQGPGVGASMMAAVGLGLYDDLLECAKQFVVYKDTYYPQSQEVKQYQNVYNRYHKVYHATKNLM